MVGAVAGHNNQVAQVDAQNRQILSGYNSRKAAYEKSNLDRVGLYAAKLIDVDIGQDEAALYARKAESEVDLEEDAAMRAILAQDEDLQLKQMQASNFADEGGRARSFGVNEARLAGRQRGKLEAAASELTVQSFIKKREARLKGDRNVQGFTVKSTRVLVYPVLPQKCLSILTILVLLALLLVLLWVP